MFPLFGVLGADAFKQWGAETSPDEYGFWSHNGGLLAVGKDPFLAAFDFPSAALDNGPRLFGDVRALSPLPAGPYGRGAPYGTGAPCPPAKKSRGQFLGFPSFDWRPTNMADRRTRRPDDGGTAGLSGLILRPLQPTHADFRDPGRTLGLVGIAATSSLTPSEDRRWPSRGTEPNRPSTGHRIARREPLPITIGGGTAR